MEIIEKQYLSIQNLLSFKTRSTYKKLRELLDHLSESLKFLELEQTGNVIFTFEENRYGTDEAILDIEFLIPVSREFKSNEYFVFKPQFKLYNALRISHSGSYEALEDTTKNVKHYLIQTGCVPITDFYYSVKKNDVNCLIDVYVGINGNIV